MDNFTFNNKHCLNDMGIYAELISRPLFAEPKTFYEDLPATDGELDFSAKNPKERICFKPRFIEFQCHFADENGSAQEFNQRVSQIASWLAESTPKSLIIGGEENVVYYAQALNLFNIEQVTDFSATFPIIFKCDPFKYSKNETSLMDFDGVTFTNNGYYCDFRFGLIGDVGAPIAIVSGDKQLVINEPLSGGDYIEVNTKDMTVLKNDKSILHKCSGDFFELKPGVNTIQVFSGGTVGIPVYYTERYL